MGSCCSPRTTNGRRDLPMRESSFAAVWAILRKECRSEWRTRYGLNAALLFAVTTLTSVSFAVGRLSDRTDILSALLWVVLFFAALSSLSHAFVREIEGHTLTLLRLVASPTAIALGKLFFNLIFLVVIEAVTVPLFLLLLGGPPPGWRGLLFVWIAAWIVLGFAWAPVVPVLGDTTRVLYFHIPAAWVTVVALAWSMIQSVLYLAKRRIEHDDQAAASAELGMLFCIVATI